MSKDSQIDRQTDKHGPIDLRGDPEQEYIYIMIAASIPSLCTFSLFGIGTLGVYVPLFDIYQ